MARTLGTVTITGISASPLGLVSVYPNPFKEEINIEVDRKQGPVNYEVYNASGNVISKGNLFSNTTLATYNYNPGLYIIKILNYDSYLIKKIVKR